MKQEKRMAKRIFSVLLTLSMAFVSFPAAFSFGAAAASATSGITGKCTWTLDGTVLTISAISGNGAMADYRKSGECPWWGETVTKVIIEQGVTTIGYGAFVGTLISEISIPNSVYSIGPLAFGYCRWLESITIPKGVMSIGGEAFSECYNLKSISVEDGNRTFHSAGNCLIKTAEKTLIVGIENSEIPGDGSVTSIGDSAFSHCTGLTSIAIPDSVTTIGDYAFDGCTALTSITIPESVTSIGDRAFEGSSLTSITIPNSVTSLGDNAFSRCTALESVTISSGLTRIGTQAFRDCTELTSVSIPDGIQSIGQSAFGGCTALASITIPESVTSIGSSCFGGCDQLTIYAVDGSAAHLYALKNQIDYQLISASGDIVGGPTGQCTWRIDGTTLTISGNGQMGDYFQDDHAPWYQNTITAVIIEKGVTSIGFYAFSGCTKLTSVTIPDSVTTIGGSAFSDCTALTNIYIPKGVKCIREDAFYNCSSLTSVNIPDTVTRIFSNAFQFCSGLTSVTIPGSIEIVGDSLFDGCTGLTNVTLLDGVTTIGAEAFSGCTNLKSITIPDSVTSVSEDAFLDCKIKELIIAEGAEFVEGTMVVCKDTLETVSIPDGVTDIGNHAFSDCSHLTNITIPGSVTRIGDYAFRCTNLTSITIPDSVTSIGDYAFSNCTGLTSITIQGGVTHIGQRAFQYCTNLTSITIPDSVATIGDGAFAGCASLTGITIPDSVTSIGNNAFLGCKIRKLIIADGSKTVTQTMIVCKDTLETVSIPDSVTTIDNYAFSRCTSLTSITIPDSVTTIGGYAFSRCTSLTSITIPDSVTSIGDYAFSGCQDFTIRTPENSEAHEYAKARGIRYYLTRTAQAPRPTVESIQKANEYGVTVTLRSTAGYEYRCDDGAWQQSPVFSGLSFGGQYRFYQRRAESTENVVGPASEPLTVVLKNNNSTVPDVPEVVSKTVSSVSLRATAGYEYRMDNGEWQQSPVFTGLAPNSTYRFYQRVAETDTAYASDSSAALTVTTPKSSVPAPGVPTLESKTADTVTLRATAGYEYRMDNGAWQKSPIFTGLAPNSTHRFYQRVAETDTAYASDSSAALTVTTPKSSVPVPGAPTLGSKTADTVTLRATAGYEYRMDNGEWQQNPIFTGLAPNSTHRFYQRVAETDTAYASNSSAALTVTTLKNSGTPAPAAPMLESKTADTVTLRATAGYEYRMDDGTWQKNPVFTGLAPNSTHRFYQRVAETDTAYASDSSRALTVTTPKSSASAPAAPMLESKTADTVTLRATAGYEYRMDNGEWQQNPAFTGLAPNSTHRFYQRVAETDTAYASNSSRALTVTTPKNSVPVPGAPTLGSKTADTVTLRATAGYEYRMDNGAWQKSPIFTGLAPNSTHRFCQRVAETDTAYASDSSAALTVQLDPLYTPGDLDGDEEITEADAIYLLMASYFPDRYPLEQSCDYDGDGEITEADAIYLLMASYFPEQYPL